MKIISWVAANNSNPNLIFILVKSGNPGKGKPTNENSKEVIIVTAGILYY
jgi:hypothetical protein